ncbi:hypothetical protein GPECTOR_37g155 [Gonium pectorale]|uniref:ABC transporter domain-containing protein n=1 Tax=Gonium pectorale TaxID=33097 RepID=A0A150FXK9_GONPE|nr:hypothetical protein GPECTOR_242g586 [Gonium pectorale]KXZ47149.1 hypothetical protein GPECTOR_37g155 [Gonium pectorale]|eukprot:KXZ41925.1 hypothetical protein GPECTOR_242g586 [Gonium pectorale]
MHLFKRRENLEYAARLRTCPRKVERLSRRAVVKAILKDLGMSHRQDRIVGSERHPGISGGERKRVNIGVGMVALPPILFLDEPTSGLDASISMMVIRLMKELTVVAGMNVIAVLHQPRCDSFVQLFDHLLLLSNRGMIVYQGPPAFCKEYFVNKLGFNIWAHVTIADVILDISSEDSTHTGNGHIRGSALAFIWLLRGAEWTIAKQ